MNCTQADSAGFPLAPSPIYSIVDDCRYGEGLFTGLRGRFSETRRYSQALLYGAFVVRSVYAFADACE